MLKYSFDVNGNMVGQAVASGVLPPQIIRQPAGPPVVELGRNASFSVVVADASGVTFRWKRNGADIPGAVGDSFLLTNVTAANEGQYSVLVTNSAGSVMSAPAELLIDSDRDGLPDQWETANFGDPNKQRAAGDPDRDGISNIDEFIDSTNPNNAASLRPRLIAFSGSGGSVTVAPMKLSYDLNETVTLTASAYEPNKFIGWTGDLVSTSNPASLVMNANKTVQAKFAAAASVPPGIVGWWKAEGDAKDVTGTNSGILLGGVAFAAGKVGQAFSFSGSAGDGVKITASSTLNVGAGPGFHDRTLDQSSGYEYQTAFGRVERRFWAGSIFLA